MDRSAFSFFAQRVSRKDRSNLRQIRLKVKELAQSAALEANFLKFKSILDIAPQDNPELEFLLQNKASYYTLDIDATSGASIIADICGSSLSEHKGKFDLIFFTEVIEHVSSPERAIANIYDLLKPGGKLYASSPFDFRIHGPLPDNWRISEHGWRELLRNFEEVEIFPLLNKHRFLMPVHYSIKAVKPLDNDVKISIKRELFS